MPEERSRPTSFGEAISKTKTRGIEDASTIEKWLDNAKGDLNNAIGAR